MSKSKKPPVDKAVATIRKPKGKDAQKVAITQVTAQGMQNSPLWGSAADLQKAVVPWTSDANALGANATLVSHLREQLRAADAQQVVLRRNWTASTSHVLATATLFCAGSADKVKSLTLDVEQRGRTGPLPVPVGLEVNPGAVPGEATAKWPRASAKYGVLLQHATDPANAATVSVPQVCTKTKITLDGMPSNANVSVRIAAIDPSSPQGQTAWSAWVVGNAK